MVNLDSQGNEIEAGALYEYILLRVNHNKTYIGRVVSTNGDKVALSIKTKFTANYGAERKTDSVIEHTLIVKGSSLVRCSHPE